MFDYQTSTYTYRFTSPIQTSSEPPVSEVTELFLPSLHYKEGQFQATLSTGGRIRYDYPAQRAYISFVDAEDGSRRQTKVRRIDIYVPGKSRGTGNISSWQVVLFVIFALVWGVVAWRTQMNEIWWDKKLGYTHSKWGTW